jgi:Tol biopolymer transport system component
VFTSIRDGDLELYTMNSNGTGMERTTCGDTFADFLIFSPNGMKRVFALH